MTIDERRLGWDERHRAGYFEGHGPNPTLAAAEIAAESIGGDPELAVERAEVVRQVPLPGRGMIDALLVLRRAAAPSDSAA